MPVKYVPREGKVIEHGTADVRNDLCNKQVDVHGYEKSVEPVSEGRI